MSRGNIRNTMVCASHRLLTVLPRQFVPIGANGASGNCPEPCKNWIRKNASSHLCRVRKAQSIRPPSTVAMQHVSHCVVQQTKSFLRFLPILSAKRRQSLSPKGVNLDLKTAAKRRLTLPLRSQNTRKTDQRHALHGLQHPSVSPSFIAFLCAATLCTPSRQGAFRQVHPSFSEAALVSVKKFLFSHSLFS